MNKIIMAAFASFIMQFIAGNAHAIDNLVNGSCLACNGSPQKTFQCNGGKLGVMCQTSFEGEYIYSQTGDVVDNLGCQGKSYTCNSDNTWTENPPPCGLCLNCYSGDWTAHSTGYESKIVKTCNCGTCESSTSYRCAAGYYGFSITGSGGCQQCPDGGMSAAGTTFIGDCYATSGNDGTGSWTSTENCYYNSPIEISRT
ncbi:MAG: hypothetical protein LBD50_02720 [Rickettsiales bacterium]|nr:hypothetical protein [Rickettsiales bacterium]